MSESVPSETPAKPEPIVPADVDLRDFPYMPLDVRRLRDCRLVAVRSSDEVVAAILLWSASWHQQPASSLPDDDVELAQLAGFGRAVKEFKRVREGALHGLIQCSDGRWYHPVVAEKAVTAWNGKIAEEYKRACDRARKENKERLERKQEILPMPPRLPMLVLFNSAGIPVYRYSNSDGNPQDDLRNSGLKGEGEGKGKGEVIDLFKTNTEKALAPNAARSAPKNGHRIDFSFETGKFTGIVDDDFARWQNAYPAVAVPDEIERCAAWMKANPEKRKKNWERFVVNWLARAQERGGRSSHA